MLTRHATSVSPPPNSSPLPFQAMSSTCPMTTWRHVMRYLGSWRTITWCLRRWFRLTGAGLGQCAAPPSLPSSWTEVMVSKHFLHVSVEPREISGPSAGSHLNCALKTQSLGLYLQLPLGTRYVGRNSCFNWGFVKVEADQDRTHLFIWFMCSFSVREIVKQTTCNCLTEQLRYCLLSPFSASGLQSRLERSLSVFPKSRDMLLLQWPKTTQTIMLHSVFGSLTWGLLEMFSGGTRTSWNQCRAPDMLFLSI